MAMLRRCSNAIAINVNAPKPAADVRMATGGKAVNAIFISGQVTPQAMLSATSMSLARLPSDPRKSISDTLTPVSKPRLARKYSGSNPTFHRERAKCKAGVRWRADGEEGPRDRCERRCRGPAKTEPWCLSPWPAKGSTIVEQHASIARVVRSLPRRGHPIVRSYGKHEKNSAPDTRC